MFIIKTMGTLLFLVGLVMIIAAIVAALGPLGLSLVDRILPFFGGMFLCVIAYIMVSQADELHAMIRAQELNMLPILMGAAVFSVGFFMLVLGLLDLLRLGGLNFGTGERVLVYLGGIFLCLLGYFMARRLPQAAAPDTLVESSSFQTRAAIPPDQSVMPQSEFTQGPPPEQF